MRKSTLLRPWYPFLLAAYPVLALLSINLGQVTYMAGIRPLFLSVTAALILFLLLQLVYRDWHRTAFATSVLVFLFFMYGHIYDVISAKWNIPHFSIWLSVVWLILAVLALGLAALRKARFESVALTLNIISLGLVLYSIAQAIPLLFANTVHASGPVRASAQVLHPLQGQTPPDIYYIMPEDYGRADFLQASFHIDVSRFMQDLKNMGFYVAECSQSNYVRSELSLGSALNMDYLQNMGPGFKLDNIDQAPIWNSIRYNAVSQDLQQAGYKTVAFATGFAWSELDDSDIYIGPSPLWYELTNFENLLLRTTPIRLMEDSGMLNLDQIDGERYRERTMLEFNSMDELAHMPGPKFVFVHVISPHEPFVFGPDGTPTDPAPFINEKGLYTLEQYTKGYQNQVPFVNQMLEKSIKTLISESATPPVIILQTDTGPLYATGSDQFKILNAYYMPGHTDRLYPGISPVNTFRVVLDSYFGANYPLLKDTSYDSPIPKIYDFSEVPNPCSAR